jgi:hypothetical protein
LKCNFDFCFIKYNTCFLTLRIVGCERMSRIIITKFSSRVLGAFLCLVGLSILAVVLWKAWPTVSASTNLFTSLWSTILAQQIEITSIGSFRLVYLFFMSIFFLGLGVIAIILSQQVFYGAGLPVLLKCPYCHNSWKAKRAKGYAECPHCRKFVQPQVIRKIG